MSRHLTAHQLDYATLLRLHTDLTAELDRRHEGRPAMSLQKLSRALYEVDWVAVQCDDAHANSQVAYLLHELEKLPKPHAIRLMAAVLEALYCIKDFTDANPFRDLADFNYMDQKIKDHPTNNL